MSEQIAVVEDEESIRSMMVRFLSLRGYQVAAFDRIHDAYRALDSAPPDLLITDLKLPDGSGLELVARLRDRHGRRFPIIILSALSSEVDFKRGFAAGADDYIRKPFLPDELLAKCENQLARHGDSHTERLEHALPKNAEGLVFDRYAVEEAVGHGSFGTVYRAVDKREQRLVALKVMNTNPGSQPEFRLRFLRETYALSSIKNPHVVRVRDFGAREGRYYYSMDFVEGPTLRQRVLLKGPATGEQVLAMLHPLTDALQALAEAGLVHRDLKPSNVILRGGDWADPVLVDFGLAKRTFDQGITHDQLLMGTPAYMAPETLTGTEPDPSSDLFALGLVGRFAVTGNTPFPELNGLALLDHMSKTPIPLPPDLPEPVKRVLRSLLQIRPPDRPPTAGHARSLVLAASEELER
ncbi:MAG: response regulator [Planctomycetota bacterium]